MYLWGNFGPYVVSYYHNLGDANANKKTAVAVIPTCISILAIFNPVGVWLMKKMPIRLILTIGCLCMLGSIYLASFMKSWWVFYIIYAYGFSTGIGLVYSIPVVLGWEWFPKRKGLISGLIIGAYGFGAFIFSFVTTALVNPDNLSPDPVTKYFTKEVTKNTRHMFDIMVLCYSVLSVIGILTISRNPEYIEKEKRRVEAEKAA